MRVLFFHRRISTPQTLGRLRRKIPTTGAACDAESLHEGLRGGCLESSGIHALRVVLRACCVSVWETVALAGESGRCVLPPQAVPLFGHFIGRGGRRFPMTTLLLVAHTEKFSTSKSESVTRLPSYYYLLTQKCTSNLHLPRRRSTWNRTMIARFKGECINRYAMDPNAGGVPFLHRQDFTESLLLLERRLKHSPS